MSEFDWVFDEVRSGIMDLVDRFVDMPYFFYSEQDMHAYLYYKLISGRLGEFFVGTSTGDRTVLLEHCFLKTPRRWPIRFSSWKRRSLRKICCLKSRAFEIADHLFRLRFPWAILFLATNPRNLHLGNSAAILVGSTWSRRGRSFSYRWTTFRE